MFGGMHFKNLNRSFRKRTRKFRIKHSSISNIYQKNKKSKFSNILTEGEAQFFLFFVRFHLSVFIFLNIFSLGLKPSILELCQMHPHLNYYQCRTFGFTFKILSYPQFCGSFVSDVRTLCPLTQAQHFFFYYLFRWIQLEGFAFICGKKNTQNRTILSSSACQLLLLMKQLV